MISITIKAASWQDDEEQLRHIRETVFIVEQNVSPELEWEGEDADALHWLAIDNDGQAVGCSRLLRDGRIGRIAILKEARGKNYGHDLLQAAIDYAEKQLGLAEVYLSAQTHAIKFYTRSGFVEEGDIYDDCGIPHITMRKRFKNLPLLGTGGGKFHVEHHAETVLSLIQQCRRKLRIIDFDLNNRVFDNQALCDAVSAVARNHRLSEVKILLIDSKAIIKSGHKLLNLQRKLPSAITIRQLENDGTVKENMVIADNCGVIIQPLLTPEAIWANFNNVPITTTKTDEFEILWNQALQCDEFKLLDI